MISLSKAGINTFREDVFFPHRELENLAEIWFWSFYYIFTPLILQISSHNEGGDINKKRWEFGRLVCGIGRCRL